jgi:hypothetical protein
MASVDLSALDVSLRQRKAKGEGLMVKKMTAGWDKVAGFKKLRVIDKIVLGSLAFKSLMQPGAKGTFNPKANAMKVMARIGEVQPAKIDLLITEVERLELEATYFAEVEGTDGRDPENYMFADHIWEHVVDVAGIDTLRAVWVGELNPSGTDAVDACNGIVTLLDSAIATDELPESLILAHSESNFVITEDNILSEIKKLVKLYRTKLPAYGDTPSVLYIAPERIAEYQFALEEALGNVNTYNSFNQVVVYYQKNIRFEPVLDLAGTDFMAIIPENNLVYLTDRKDSKTELDSDYSKRDRSIALVADWWFAPEVYRMDIIATNDLRARPVLSGE